MKQIKKSIEIKSTPKNIWEVLFIDKNYRQWASEFSKDSYAVTDWQKGSKVIFTDPSQSGLIGTITGNKPYQFLGIEYDGQLLDGKEDYDSAIAKNIKGGIETYTLTERGDTTELSIVCDMDETYFETMSQAWDKALKKIKDIAEK